MALPSVGIIQSVEASREEKGLDLFSLCPTTQLDHQSSPAPSTPGSQALRLGRKPSSPQAFELHHQSAWVSSLNIAVGAFSLHYQ